MIAIRFTKRNRITGDKLVWRESHQGARSIEGKYLPLTKFDAGIFQELESAGISHDIGCTHDWTLEYIGEEN